VMLIFELLLSLRRQICPMGSSRCSSRSSCVWTAASTRRLIPEHVHVCGRSLPMLTKFVCAAPDDTSVKLVVGVTKSEAPLFVKPDT
jgi:hypothetical protein